MIRGINRQMVIIKTEKSSIFEAAYFLVRPEASPRASRDEMINEANRIISDNNFSSRRKKDEQKRKIKNGIPFFLWGGALGMLFIGALWLISL